MVIQIENLVFQYSGAVKPTLNISKLEIQKGERIFLFGPSGSGKSTLLEILSGVLVPQKGTIRLLGQELTKMTDPQRDHFRGNHLGYVFQSFNLIPYLSVKENIQLPVFLNSERRKRILDIDLEKETFELCQSLGIENFLDKKVTELSVGQQQRVAVARALLGSPELILADEPTSSLDFDHREKFIKLLFKVSDERKTTVLFVSHDRTLEKLFSRSISFHDVNQVEAR